MPWFINKTYPKADAIVAVSTGVAEDFYQETQLPLQAIKVIYNPVVTPELLQKKQEALNHPWFKKNQPPVLLAVGRLCEQKDFTTLINAFAIIRKKSECRLIILGEGEQRKQLETLVDHLQLNDDIQMPGFVKNPYAYMVQADIFVLSSAWEGLVTVLIEALACGTPVVSTDCPSGSSEILEAGKYGRLVPVGDTQALAEAVITTMEENVDPNRLIARANDFTQETSVTQYLAVLDSEKI
jgi:glycosyltransferase involved in cell wall biosynthesis